MIDLIIIGGGPARVTAALRARELGRRAGPKIRAENGIARAVEITKRHAAGFKRKARV